MELLKNEALTTVPGGFPAIFKRQKNMETNSTILAGKTFCITGTLSKGRKQYITLIEQLGGTFRKNVSSVVNFLVVGPDAYEKDTDKLERAHDMNVFLLSESEFMKMAGV